MFCTFNCLKKKIQHKNYATKDNNLCYWFKFQIQFWCLAFLVFESFNYLNFKVLKYKYIYFCCKIQKINNGIIKRIMVDKRIYNTFEIWMSNIYENGITLNCMYPCYFYVFVPSKVYYFSSFELSLYRYRYYLYNRQQ